MKRLFFVLLAVCLLCGCLQEEEASLTRPYSPEFRVTDLIEPYPATLTSSTIPSPATSTTLPYHPMEDVIHSSWASSPPEVDGVVSPGEWSDASVIVLSGFERLYVMNNHSHLFFLYRVLDGRRLFVDSALFVDPNGDGRFNYVHGDNKVFMVFPLFGAAIGDGGGIYCGNSVFGVSGKNCRSFERIISESRISYSLETASIVSEVSIPYEEDEAFFWLLYGHPSPLCFPESLQCHSDPSFARVVLSDGPGDVAQILIHGDSIGPLDYYDIKPPQEPEIYL